MGRSMSAAWRKMCGSALLWVGLSSLVYVGTSGGAAAMLTVVSIIGFAAFAAGLGLFSDGVKREILAQIDS